MNRILATLALALTGLPVHADELYGWEVKTQTDNFTGETSRYIVSPTVTLRGLEFPYAGTRSWLSVVGCLWFQLGYTNSPNLVSNRTEIRWANHSQYRGLRRWTSWTDFGDIRVRQRGDDRYLHLPGSREIVWALEDQDWMRHRTSWYGSGAAVAQYDTRGFAAAYRKIGCKVFKPNRRQRKMRQERIDNGDRWVGCDLVEPGCESPPATETEQ